MVRRSVLLVGQAPGADGDSRPLTGTMGKKLAALCGLQTMPRGFELTPPDERIGVYFDLANVLDFYPGPDGKGHAFPREAARAAASDMWFLFPRYDMVLFCGKAVFEAFRSARAADVRRRWRDLPMMQWDFDGYDERTLYAWMPHTSGVVTWWNDPRNEVAAQVFLRRLRGFAEGARDMTPAELLA